MLQLALLIVGSSLSIPSLPDAQPHTDGDRAHRLSRYQIALPRPTEDQRDLLAAIIDIDLPVDVKTVGQAIAVVIEGSGYRLSTPKASCQKTLLDLPLPSIHRNLGPLSLGQTLEILSGPAYRPAIDPASRSVSFERVPPTELPDATGCGCE